MFRRPGRKNKTKTYCVSLSVSAANVWYVNKEVPHDWEKKRKRKHSSWPLLKPVECVNHTSTLKNVHLHPCARAHTHTNTSVGGKKNCLVTREIFHENILTAKSTNPVCHSNQLQSLRGSHSALFQIKWKQWQQSKFSRLIIRRRSWNLIWNMYMYVFAILHKGFNYSCVGKWKVMTSVSV